MYHIHKIYCISSHKNPFFFFYKNVLKIIWFVYLYFLWGGHCGDARFFFIFTDYTEWSKKCLSCDLDENCLRNSKIFFDGVFLSIYSHILKKLWGSKNPENGLFQKSHLIKKETYFFVLFLFMLQDNSYSCPVLRFKVSKLKIAIEVVKLSMRPLKRLFLKRL